ncbi:DUF3237 family protein [Nocardia sp. NPDC023852]|uniref:DUF3237 family protein n=1 Tax=Nocardia sp. NPDC023852 TaxID=3154697 RepID=UPI0033C0FC34
MLAGGGDWALLRPDGTLILDVRLTLRTHDDALVPALRDRREAVRVAQRHCLRRVGVPVEGGIAYRVSQVVCSLDSSAHRSR